MTLSEKAAYIKGLAEGLDLDTDKKEARIPQGLKGILVANIFVIISVIFIGVSAYSYLIERPKLNDYILAGNSYVNKDYSAVIDTLTKYELKALPKGQKQILAASSINVLSLTPEQKQRVLAGISSSTNDAILDSWIALGRGDYETAIESAYKADDKDLHLYALVRYKDALTSGNNEYKEMSGSEIKTRLDDVNKQIDEVMKENQEAVNEDGQE